MLPMQNETLTFVKNVLAKNGIHSGYQLEELCVHAEFLIEKSRLIKENKKIQNYEPIFALYQRPFIKE
jgi:hypothetical protein